MKYDLSTLHEMSPGYVANAAIKAQNSSLAHAAKSQNFAPYSDKSNIHLSKAKMRHAQASKFGDYVRGKAREAVRSMNKIERNFGKNTGLPTHRYKVTSTVKD